MKQEKKYYIYQLDIKVITILSFVIIGIVFGMCYLINPEFSMESLHFFITGTNSLIILLMILGYSVLHEIVHSISYVLNGANFKYIVYGLELEKGIFYCLCKENITKRNILISAMAPFMFLGVVTLIISFIIKSPYLFLLSVFNLGGCSGDILTFLFISKMPENTKFTEFDEPTSFALYSNKDISKTHGFGLKYIETTDEVKRENFKKINISKGSMSVFKLFIIFAILMFIIGFIIGLIIVKKLKRGGMCYDMDYCNCGTYLFDNYLCSCNL